MPELPEVETVRRWLSQRLEGRRFLECCVHREDVFRRKGGFLPVRLREIHRHGKILCFDFDKDCHLVVHFRMTGGFYLRKENEARRPHTHVEFRLAGKTWLAYHDSRRFGGLWWFQGEDPHSQPPLMGQAPDALAVSADDFVGALGKRCGSLKPLLLDQKKVVSGLGNIYTDEILYRCAIHPEQVAGELIPDERKKIWSQMRAVLSEAIRYGGTTIRDFSSPDGRPGAYQFRHQVYGREGEPCSRCGTPIERVYLGQRATHFCPECQFLKSRINAFLDHP